MEHVENRDATTTKNARITCCLHPYRVAVSFVDEPTVTSLILTELRNETSIDMPRYGEQGRLVFKARSEQYIQLRIAYVLI